VGTGAGGEAGSGSAGRRFGRYRLLDPLGDGSTDEWLRAQDVEDGRDVVLHVLPLRESQDPVRRARFLRELPVVARLTEPRLLPVVRYGETDGRLFVARPLVQAEHLSSVLARTGPLHPARAVDLVGQLARALDAAHAAGLVHRDVRPSGVLLEGRADGGDLADSAAGEDVVRLADLGDPAPTRTGGRHPAPELLGGGPVDGRADVYSLAALLFELLTGRRPPADPPEPSSLHAGLTRELDGVVLRGLAADPDQRWTSAGGMAAAARAVLALAGMEVSRPGDTRPAGPAAAGQVDRRRTMARLATPAAVVLAVLAAVAVGRRLRSGADRRGRRAA
jgi:serine/threonine-protein kinase